MITVESSVVGHGDIASVITDRENPDRIYFASGVSNSQETRESEYAREVNLLMDQNRRKRLVYFSSLAVFYGDNRYVQHKKIMEGFVKHCFPEYTIVRIGNITWGSNPHTLVNFLRSKITNNEPYEVRDEYRYLIDKPEFLHWMNMIPNWNVEMNVPGKMMKVADIVQEIKEGKL